jgi:hypothetical protein
MFIDDDDEAGRAAVDSVITSMSSGLSQDQVDDLGGCRLPRVLALAALGIPSAWDAER